MRWRDRPESENVEDRRGMPVRTMAVGGGIGTVILAIVVMLLGGDPGAVLQQQAPAGAPAPGDAGAVADRAPVDPAQEDERKFAAVILRDTEDVWTDLFEKAGRTYEKPKLVLFTQAVESACGTTSAAVGPFYCPADAKVYLDLGFFDELSQRFRAPGEFARAYVIAHEVGHHVQNLLGISDKVERARRAAGSKAAANDLSVRLELQADYFAGVWAHHGQQMKGFLENGDIQSALNAASQIGDDRLQQETRGYVVPDSFTHGTSAQRAKWFLRGYKTGDIQGGDTFRTNEL